MSQYKGLSRLDEKAATDWGKQKVFIIFNRKGKL